MAESNGANPTPKTSVRIAISEIYADPKFNTRDNDKGEMLQEEIGKMAESLKREGQINPVVVHPFVSKRKGGDSAFKYELTAGFRRFAAARMLGWTDIEAKTLDAPPSESERKILNLVENMQRKDLAPFEFAEACSALIDTGLKGPEIAKRVGVSTPHVNNMVRLRQKLHPDLWASLRKVKDGVRTGSETTLNWLLSVAALPHAEQLEKLKERIGEPGADDGSNGGGGSGGGEGSGNAGTGIRAPSKRKVEEYLSALKTVPKTEREAAHDDVVKAIKWCRGLLKNPPIKVTPRAEAEDLRCPPPRRGVSEDGASWTDAPPWSSDNARIGCTSDWKRTEDPGRRMTWSPSIRQIGSSTTPRTRGRR